ncbi:MAG: leucyl/phenylalanyl-tRNA--protein transferase [Mariprofundus sp.]|nr:leucyl/phenylalanyl-tRNA--protein transferase [Mariprofundus sp.]
MRLITFPEPSLANKDGLLAMGGDLRPATLLAAYAQGIFPWYGRDDPILWWSPDPRMVLFPDNFHCSKRLARRLKQARYRFSHNESFAEVIDLCAHIPRKDEGGTWILPEMITAYSLLHAQGFAHSFEVWEGDLLIGGLYGVLHKQLFFAESMFSRKRDASKMAVAQLVDYARLMNCKLIDCQFHTEHLFSLGGREISRQAFMALITKD